MAAHEPGSPLVMPARFVLLLRLLGCWPGELAGLLVTDIHLDQRELLFRDTKNGTDRRVHTTDQVAGLIAAQRDDTPEYAPYLFSTWGRKGEWRPYNYSYAVKKLRASCLVGQDFHAHAMRREFISRAIEAGLTYSTIRKQTGHKSTQAIEIYDEALSTAPEIRAALDKLEVTVRREQLDGAFEALGNGRRPRASAGNHGSQGGTNGVGESFSGEEITLTPNACGESSAF